MGSFFQPDHCFDKYCSHKRTTALAFHGWSLASPLHQQSWFPSLYLPIGTPVPRSKGFRGTGKNMSYRSLPFYWHLMISLDKCFRICCKVLTIFQCSSILLWQTTKLSGCYILMPLLRMKSNSKFTFKPFFLQALNVWMIRLYVPSCAKKFL